jgi:hypothetical protein
MRGVALNFLPALALLRVFKQELREQVSQTTMGCSTMSSLHFLAGFLRQIAPLGATNAD